MCHTRTGGRNLVPRRKGGIEIKKVVLFLVLALTLAVGIQQIGLAVDRQAGGKPDRLHDVAGFLKDPSLTKAQRERIAALQEKHFRAAAPLRQRMAEAVFNYRQTMTLNPDDQKTLATQRQRIEENLQALRRHKDKFHAELMRILTPEQQAKLRDTGFGEWGGRRGFSHRDDCGRQ